MRVITGDLGNTSISQCQFTVSGLRCSDNCNLVWMEWKKVWVGLVCLWRRVTHVRCSGGDRRSSTRRRAAAQQPGHDHGSPQCNDTNNYTRASFITVRTAEQNLGDCTTLYCPHKVSVEHPLGIYWEYERLEKSCFADYLPNVQHSAQLIHLHKHFTRVPLAPTCLINKFQN